MSAKQNPPKIRFALLQLLVVANKHDLCSVCSKLFFYYEETYFQISNFPRLLVAWSQANTWLTSIILTKVSLSFLQSNVD